MLGVSVLSTVFAGSGSYVSPQAFTDGLTAALWVGAAVLAAGVVAALLVPGHRAQAATAEQVAAADQAAAARRSARLTRAAGAEALAVT